MKQEIIGYDFDGVIFEQHHEGWFGKLMWKIFPRTTSYITHSFAKKRMIFMIPDSYIITGRPGVTEEKLTRRQMREWGLDAKLFIDMSKDKPNRKSSIDWKVENINLLGITRFYEDDDETIKVLRKLTKAEIIKV